MSVLLANILYHKKHSQNNHLLKGRAVDIIVSAKTLRGVIMVILMVGDVVGSLGCRAIERYLPQIKREYGAEIAIVNGENSAQGNGILPSSANALWNAGADVITTGNHVYRRREIYEVLDSNSPIVRPANYPSQNPGRGVYVVDSLKYHLAVINMMGTAMLEPLQNPFLLMDELLKKIDTPFVVLDFHAEATSEKRAMGFYLDGRVTAVVGTHTHIQTADEQLLPQKTAYITDVGMCGPECSVLGVKPEQAIRRFVTSLPTRFENADGAAIINAVAIEADPKTGRARSIERINRLVEV